MCSNLLKVVTIALLLIAPSSARAVIVPAGLSFGDEYHLAFLTDGTHNAVSTSILTYNAFVQAQAALNSSLTGVQWFVIGSTQDDDARGNALVSAPVYLLDGTTKVADGFTDMWDDGDGIENPIDIDQHGSSVVSPSTIFTGSKSDGTTHFDGGVQRFLGSTSNVVLGDPAVKNPNWIDSSFTSSNDDSRSFYALSELLTVVPEPTTCTLALAALSLVMSRRRAF